MAELFWQYCLPLYVCLHPLLFFAPSLFLSEAIQAFLSDEIENNKFMGCCISSPAHAAFDLAVVFVVAIAVLHWQGMSL